MNSIKSTGPRREYSTSRRCYGIFISTVYEANYARICSDGVLLCRIANRLHDRSVDQAEISQRPQMSQVREGNLSPINRPLQLSSSALPTSASSYPPVRRYLKYQITSCSMHKSFTGSRTSAKCSTRFPIYPGARLCNASIRTSSK